MKTNQVLHKYDTNHPTVILYSKKYKKPGAFGLEDWDRQHDEVSVIQG